MRNIPAAKFKQQCLAILDRIDGEGVIITKHGKPVAKVVPVSRQSSDLIGILREKIKVKGSLRSTGVKWNAES